MPTYKPIQHLHATANNHIIVYKLLRQAVLFYHAHNDLYYFHC